MSQEAKPPRLVVPITPALCTGTLACIGSSRDAQILGVVGFCLGLVFTLSLPPVVARCAVRPGTKKIVLVLVGFLILVGACYIIARLDASLRTHGLLWGEANHYAPRNGTGKHLAWLASNSRGSYRSYRLLQARDCLPAKRRHFCTLFHRFAQRFDQNLIDGANGTLYLARQIEPGSFGTLRINLEGAASLTAAAPRD